MSSTRKPSKAQTLALLQAFIAGTHKDFFSEWTLFPRFSPSPWPAPSRSKGARGGWAVSIVPYRDGGAAAGFLERSRGHAGSIILRWDDAHDGPADGRPWELQGDGDS